MSEGNTMDTNNNGLVHNVISADITGYIRIERLEERLRRIFKREIQVRHIRERFVFEAPREVTEAEIADLKENERVN